MRVIALTSLHSMIINLVLFTLICSQKATCFSCMNWIELTFNGLNVGDRTSFINIHGEIIWGGDGILKAKPNYLAFIQKVGVGI